MKKNTRVKLASNNHTDYIDKAYTMNQDLQEIIKFAYNQLFPELKLTMFHSWTIRCNLILLFSFY